MSTYISLTNELLRRMGEVVLDTTEFDGARNIQSLAKNAINSINVDELAKTAIDDLVIITKPDGIVTVETQ